MKKLFITLMACILVTLGITVITRSDFYYKEVVKDIAVGDIYINDLQIKNSTYHYENLSDNEKRLYRTIANGVMNLDENITVEVTKSGNYSTIKEDIEVALNAFFADHPEVFYINDKYEISFIDTVVIKTIKLKLSYISDNMEEINSMKEELNHEIDNINSKLVNCKSDYEKELLIHDLIAKDVSYFTYDNYEDIPNIKHTAYGALVEKSAVCDGITKAFQIILSQNNIDSVFVTGSSEGIPHAWCKVKLEDAYYNVDLTSDKAINSSDKSLVIHSYFNITDEEILKTHTFDNNVKSPSATATKYNYYVYNDYTISYFDSFEYKLGQIVQSQNSKTLLEFNVNGVSEVPEKMVESLYNLNFNSYKTNNITKVQYHKINDNYIVVK